MAPAAVPRPLRSAPLLFRFRRDALGANEGALVAEALANAGRRVCLVTPYETVMPYGGTSHRMETPDILRRKLAAIYTEAMIGLADGHHVSVVRADGGERDRSGGQHERRDHRAQSARAARRDDPGARVATDAFRDREVAALQL